MTLDNLFRIFLVQRKIKDLLYKITSLLPLVRIRTIGQAIFRDFKFYHNFTILLLLSIFRQ